MNKQALKLKQKRRIERLNAKNNAINKTWDDMCKHIDELNLPKLEKNKENMLRIYKATKEIDNKVFNKSAVISIICALQVLSKCYNFDTHSLLDYAEAIRNCIIKVGTSSNKSIGQLIDEIEQDYDVPIIQKCKMLPRLDMSDFNKFNMDDTIIKSTPNHFPFFIAVNAYTFMNYMAFEKYKEWNKEDLELFINESFVIYGNILSNTKYLYDLRNELINSHHIEINLDNGNISELLTYEGENV